MTEELKKQGGAIDDIAAEVTEATGGMTTAVPELDAAAKAAAEREARRQALYEENERAEDERARAEAERMRDVDDDDEDETPRDTWATVRRLWSEAAGDHWRFYIVFASIVFYVIFNTAAPAYSALVIDELWERMQVAFANNTTFSITWENCGKTIFVYFMIWTAAGSFYALQSFLMSSVAERLNLRLRKRLAAGHHADQRVLPGKVGLLARYILPGEPPCVGYFRSFPDKAHLQTVLVQLQQAVVQRTLHAKLVAQQFVVANKALAVQRPLQVKGKARIVLALTALFEQQVVRVLLIGFVENAVVAILLNKDILAGDVVLSAASACGKAHRQQRRQHQRKQGSQFLVHGVPPFCQTLSNSADR